MAKKSRADRKKQTQKNVNGQASVSQNNATEKTSNKENGKKEADKKITKQEPVKYEAQPAPKLTVYTISAMLALMGAAAATVSAMIMMAKPVTYVVDSYYGASFDLYWLDAIQRYVLSEDAQSHITTMFTIIAVLVIVATIFTLIDVVKVLNPKNKPALIMSVLSFCASAAALIIYLYTYGYADERFELSVYEYDEYFGIYKILFIVLAVNAVLMLINIIGNAIGFSKWKKTRKAY